MTSETEDVAREDQIFLEDALGETRFRTLEEAKGMLQQMKDEAETLIPRENGMEIVESSHYLIDNQVLNKIQKEQMLWNRFASDSTSSVQNGSTEQSNTLSTNKDNSDISDSQENSNISEENSSRFKHVFTNPIIAELHTWN